MPLNMESISTLKWYFVDNFTDLLQQDLLLANCMYIESTQTLGILVDIIFF